MKKLAIGDVLSIVANFGVILGLFLLVYELRQNTQAIRLNAVQFQASEEAAFNRLWTDPALAKVRAAMEANGYDSLSAEEQLQMYGTVQSFLRIQQGLYYQLQQGGLDPTYWTGRHRQLVRLFQTLSFLDVWRREGYAYDDAFREYIDAVVIPEGAR